MRALFCWALLLLVTNDLWMPGQFLAWGAMERKLQAVARLPRGWELREALEKLDKELYDNAPGPERPFLAALKNPCWPASGGGGADGGGAVSCLPYAMVIGGFHCGAASLWQALYKHPLVAKSDVSRWHFWAEFDKKMSGYLEGTAKAAARVAAWPAAVDAAAKAVGAAAGGGDAGGVAWLRRQQKILLDGSSSTFAFYWSPNVRAHRAFVGAMVPCWEGCHKAHKEGPEREECLGGCYGAARQADRQVAASIGLPYNDISLPLLISAVYGRRPPKMVVLMRNPVDRLYSAYWRYGHYRDKFGPSAEGFETYAREQLTALRTCMARNGTDSAVGCVLHFETWGLQEERLYFHADQLLRGVYSVWLEIWLKFFDRKDLLVIRSEDYFADPVEVYGKVLEWLGLDPSAIDYHARLDKLARAAAVGDVDAVAKAMATPVDDKLWVEIKEILMEGESRIGSRFEINRKAAAAGQEQLEQQRGGGGGGSRSRRRGGAADDGVGLFGGAAGGGRPPMSPAIRRELAEFYAPYNRRLADLLQDPTFIRGWD